MSDQMAVEGPGDAPTAHDASTALAALHPVQRRSRQIIRDAGMGRPLVAWGVAWIAGAVALHVLADWRGAAVGSVLCVLATAVSWLGVDRQLVRGFERQFAVGWMVLLLSSPLLVVVVAPPDRDVLVIFLGCLWALGMLLYGIGTNDRPMAAVGGFVLVISALARLTVPASAMVTVGVTGGLALALLGVRRMWTAR